MYVFFGRVSPLRNLFDYDQVVNTQRDRVYAERRRALLTDDLSPLLVEYAEKTCDDILEVRRHTLCEWSCDQHLVCCALPNVLGAPPEPL